MLSSLCRRCLVVLLFVAWALPARGDDPVARIFAAWRLRRERSPTVRYKLKGECTWPRGAFNEDVESMRAELERRRGESADEVAAPSPAKPDNPDADVTTPSSRDVILDFPNNRYRVDRDERLYDWNSRQVYRLHTLNMWDGQTRLIRVFEDSQPGLGAGRARPHVDLEIMRGDPESLPAGEIASGYEALFFAHGIVRGAGVHVRPTRLSPPLDASGFAYQGRGVYEGRDCEILSNGNLEFWVDPEREGAIVQFVANPDRKYVIQIDYQETAAGWLPKSWTTTLSVSSAVRYRKRMTVEEIDAGPALSDDLFRIAPEPGMYVHDVTVVRSEARGAESHDRYRLIEPGGRSRELDARLLPVDGPRD